MLKRWLEMGALRAPEDPPDDGGGGGDDPPDDPPGEKKPFAVFDTQAAFDDRLARSTRAQLKELGIDPEAYKADKEKLAELEGEKKKRDQEAMSEKERLEAELAESKTKEAAAERAAATSKARTEIVERCARLGIKDVDYAAFRLGQLEEGTNLDEWLAETLKDETERARFGLGAAGAPPKTTTTGGGGAPGDPPPKKPSGEQGGDAKDVSGMTPQEFEAHKAGKHGVHS
jgi:hypothetical protein